MKVPRNFWEFYSGCVQIVLMNRSKSVEITNTTCKLIEKNEPTGGPQTPICKKYRHGICQEGNKCKFSHPAKCLDYCRYGRDGCSEGFNKCKLLHPILCRGSLNYNQCFDSTCTLAHLKGTKRFSDQNLSNKQRQVPYQTISSRGYPKGNGQSKYSRFDPNYLGFQRYRPPYQRQNSSNYLSSERPKINGEFQSGSANNMQSNGFSYSSNEFPALNMSAAPSDGYNQPNRNGLLNSNQSNNEGFLELLRVDEVDPNESEALPARANGPETANPHSSKVNCSRVLQSPSSSSCNRDAGTTTEMNMNYEGSSAIMFNIQGINPSATSKQRWKHEYLSKLISSSSTHYLVIGLTESWLKPHISDAQIDMQLFNVFRADRVNRERGGALLYIHKHIPVNHESFDDDICQAIFCVSSATSYMFACAYKPCDASEKSFSQMLEFLHNCINHTSDSYKYTKVIIGSQIYGQLAELRFPPKQSVSVT